MSDVVVTVPKNRWADWIDEGDLPGQEWDGTYQYSFYVSSAPSIDPGERVYIVAHGRLRGYAPLAHLDPAGSGYSLVRYGGAVAVTIPDPIGGFRGFRYRWWDRRDEVPFPNWREP